MQEKRSHILNFHQPEDVTLTKLPLPLQHDSKAKKESSDYHHRAHIAINAE
jgi:hypothetical protein